jgi:disulfide bond formation protein DsbB
MKGGILENKMGETGQAVNSTRRRIKNTLQYLAWFIALVATVGSLFFSEVMRLPPCVLCWYQRIAMYPLVIIIAIGIAMRDSRMRNYALPVCLIGLAVSIYHNLLYYRIIPESLAPCVQGISCTSRQIEWLGFITIPMMALAAFIGLSLCLLFYKSEQEGE